MSGLVPGMTRLKSVGGKLALADFRGK